MSNTLDEYDLQERHYWLVRFRRPRRSFKWATSYHLANAPILPLPKLPSYISVNASKRVKYRKLLTYRKGIDLTKESYALEVQRRYVRHMYYVGDL